MFTLKLKIGRSYLEYQDNDIKKIHRFGSVYGAMPERCDVCNSDNIYLSFKSPKDNDYYTLTCKECGAELSLHQKKEGGFYIKFGEKMQKYSRENNQADNLNDPKYQQNVQNVKDAFEDKDIPF